MATPARSTSPSSNAQHQLTPPSTQAFNWALILKTSLVTYSLFALNGFTTRYDCASWNKEMDHAERDVIDLGLTSSCHYSTDSTTPDSRLSSMRHYLDERYVRDGLTLCSEKQHGLEKVRKASLTWEQYLEKQEARVRLEREKPICWRGWGCIRKIVTNLTS